MNLDELLKDERGLEMVKAFHKLSEDRIVFTYQELVDYVNNNGMDEAYKQYQAMQDKVNVYTGVSKSL